MTVSTGLVTASTDPSAEKGIPSSKVSTKDFVFRNQQRRTFLSVGEERFVHPFTKGKRYETLRVSDYMSCADGGTGDHLRPKAPCAGPICGANSWPYGITVQLVPASKSDCSSHGPRAVSIRAAETCADKSAASGSISGAHWAQGRARLIRNLFPHPRARFEIQTDMQTEPRDRKPFG